MSRTEAASVEASMVSNSRHVSDRRKRAEKGRKISRDENRAVRHRVVGASQGGGFVDVIPGKWFLFFFGWGDGGSPDSCLRDLFSRGLGPNQIPPLFLKGVYGG